MDLVKQASNKRWYKAHPNYMKEYREVHPDYGRKWREEHPHYHRDYFRELKGKVLTHYGNGKCGCVVCSESRLACLSIDHINGGGSRHLRGIKRTGNTFYQWLKMNNYPEGYQTLCMNCQFVKRVENGETGGRKNVKCRRY